MFSEAKCHQFNGAMEKTSTDSYTYKVWKLLADLTLKSQRSSGKCV